MMQQQPRQSPGPKIMSPKAEIQLERGRSMDAQVAGAGGMAQGAFRSFICLKLGVFKYV
jgi:hypothetical protein